MLEDGVRFGILRVFPLGLCIVGGYALTLFGWDSGWMPTAYIAFTIGIVLAQGFLLSDREAGLREFFWVSLFFLLTTPLLQFSRIHTDHYGFYTIGSLAGTNMPYMLALLLNLLIASTAGLAFQLLWRHQYSGASDGTSALRRAAFVVLPPLIFAYVTVVVITNISVSVHLTVLLPVLGVCLRCTLGTAGPGLQPQRAGPVVPARYNVGSCDDLGSFGDRRHSGDIPVAGPAQRSAGPQSTVVLGNQPRRAGLFPGRGAGPYERRLRVAHDMGLRLYVLSNLRQADGVPLSY